MSEPEQTLRFNSLHSVIRVAPGTKVAAISDLHIGVAHRREIAGKGVITDDQVMEGVKRLIRDIKPVTGRSHLVLNGDVFEMLYSPEPTDKEIFNLPIEEHHRRRDAQREKYIKWLKAFIEVAKENNCTIHYIGGNHDDNGKFIHLLQELEKKEHEKAGSGQENFLFHPVALRLGPVLFTHGDLVLRAAKKADERAIDAEHHYITERHVGDLGKNTTINPFKAREKDPPENGLLSHRQRVTVYKRRAEIKTNATLHDVAENIINRFQPPQKRAAKILASLCEAHMLDASLSIPTPVTRICTGHTHDGYLGLKLSGDYVNDTPDVMAHASRVTFDNTGSALSEKRLHAVQYTLTNDKVLSAKKITPSLITGRVDGLPVTRIRPPSGALGRQ